MAKSDGDKDGESHKWLGSHFRKKKKPQPIPQLHISNPNVETLNGARINHALPVLTAEILHRLERVENYMKESEGLTMNATRNTKNREVRDQLYRSAELMRSGMVEIEKLKELSQRDPPELQFPEQNRSSEQMSIQEAHTENAMDRMDWRYAGEGGGRQERSPMAREEGLREPGSPRTPKRSSRSVASAKSQGAEQPGRNSKGSRMSEWFDNLEDPFYDPHTPPQRPRQMF